MHRRWAWVRASLFVGSLLIALVPLGTVQASTPSSGSISFANPSLAWASSTPMTGTAPSRRQVFCNVTPTACDNFTLTINTVKRGHPDPNALVDIKIAPSAGASMRVVVYPPGCSPALTVSAPCYGAFGTEAKMLNPTNGTYTIQVACTACASATYTARATLADFYYSLPAAGGTQFGFVNTQLPAFANGSSTSYGEPGIWINSSGNAIVNTFGPTVWVSNNAGQTWSSPVDLLNRDTLCPQGYSGDGDAVIGNDNTFYADNLCVGTGAGSSNDSFSNTQGGAAAGWTGPYVAGTNVDRQWYTPDPVHAGVVYMQFHDLNGPNINVLKSTDGGHTFNCPVTGLVNATACPVTATPVSNVISANYLYTAVGNVTGRSVIDPTNSQRIYVPYADNSSANGAVGSTPDFDLNRVRLAVSTDGGHTWKSDANPAGTPVLDANRAFPYDGVNDNTVAHNFPILTADTAGNLYFLISVRLGSSMQTHLYLISSTDQGSTWTRPVQVDSGTGSNLMPWIAAGSPGHVVIAWYGSLATSFNDTNAAWSEMFSESVNALASPVTFTQANISGTATPVHVGDICEVGLNCAVTGGNRDLSDFQMIAVDPCGFAQPVWTDDHTGSGVTIAGRQTAGPTAYSTLCKK